MILHIFNPEHDIALASGLANFTAPHAARQLRHDLGYLPALWAEADDAVLVDDAAHARRASMRKPLGCRRFVEKSQLGHLPITRIVPWGWDAALCHELRLAQVDEQLLPSADALSHVRRLSHRALAAHLLPQLQTAGTVGEAVEYGDEALLRSRLAALSQKVVLKAPWSSSGRGVRFVAPTDAPYYDGWLSGVFRKQGSVMMEPYYNKVQDFAMEFHADGRGTVRYLGLSLFRTSGSAYTGNLLATEQEKQELLGRYLPASLLQTISERLCQLLGASLGTHYEGPLGVDMMVVGLNDSEGMGNDEKRRANDKGYLLHPCVEVNLRRTMGHVALALSPHERDRRRVMLVTMEQNIYKLKLLRK